MKPIKKKHPTMLLVEHQHNCQLEELLRRLYVDQNCSIQQVADTLGIHYITAQHWLKKAGVYSHKLKL